MVQTGKALPESLRRLERRLETPRSMQAEGRISALQLQEEIGKLKAADEHGRTWWLAGEAGAWHWWDGHSWLAGDPGRVLPQGPPPAHARNAPARTAGPRVGLFAALGCTTLAAVSAIAAGTFLLGGYAEYRALPKIVEDVQVDAAAVAPLPLSSDQRQVRADLGDPEAFLILFYEETLEDGSIGDVRTETWSYYSKGVEYTFINGEIEGEASIAVQMEGLRPAPYRPEQFQAYMSLEDVLAVTGIDSFLVVPLETELVDGGEVCFADRLTFGLKGGELRQVEALALDVEG